MSKWRWLFLILILTPIVYLAIWRFVPGVGPAIDSAIGPQVGNFFGGIYTMVTTNPTWINYDIWFTFIGGCLLTGLVFWQAHNAYNFVRQKAARSAQKEAYGTPVIAAPMKEPSSVVVQESAVPTRQPAPQQEEEAKT